MKIEWIDIAVGNEYNVIVDGQQTRVKIVELGDTRPWTWDNKNAWGTFVNGPFKDKRFAFTLTWWAERKMRGNTPVAIDNHGPGVWMAWNPELQ